MTNDNLKIFDNTITIGCYVSYEQNSKNYLAKVLNIKNGKIVIENHVNQEIEIPSSRLYKLANPQNKELNLSNLFNECQKKATQISLEEIWEFIHDEINEATDYEIAKLYFGTNIFLEEHFSLRLALLNDKIFFKRLKETFEPRKTSSIEELKKAKASQDKKKENFLLTTQIFYKRIVAKEDIEIPSSIRPVINLLLKYASGKEGFSNNEIKEIKEIISTINSTCKFETPNTSPKQAFFLLKKANILFEHSNLFFYKYDYQDTFSKNSLDEIPLFKEKSNKLLQDDTRENLIGKSFSFSVDDITTLDIDDALSIKKINNENYEVGIHITDLSELIDNATYTFKDAFKKGTSIYLPEKTYDMLPNELSHDIASLVDGQKRCALSLIINVNSLFEITNYRFARSIVSIDKRLTYDELDDMLEHGNNEDLLFLHGFSSQCEINRIENGAFSITRKDVNIVLDEDYNVSLKERNDSTPAQNLVGELMILYNNLFAVFAKEHHIPLFFRSQEEAPEISQSILDMKEGPVKNYLMRSNMMPSETRTSANFHSGLGLNAYAQCTSPLRRMMDFINQKQVSLFLKNNSISYSDKELQEMLFVVEESLKTAGLISKETKRYWLIEYLRQQKQKGHDTYKGTVLRIDLRFPLVEIDEVYMNYVVKSPRPLAVGEEVTLKINNANAREDILSLEVK